MSQYDIFYLIPLIPVIYLFISILWESQEEIDEKEREINRKIKNIQEQDDIDRNCL